MLVAPHFPDRLGEKDDAGIPDREDAVAIEFCAMYGKTHMPDQESDILKLEDRFPSISGAAFAAARDRVLASGQSVLLSEQGVIYEVFPDGSRRRVKEIEPPVAVEPGQKIHIG